MKSYQEKKWAWPWVEELSKILEFPFNMFPTAEASELKFGMQFGFSKARHKITPTVEVGVALG